MPPPVPSAAVHPLDVVRTRFQGCDRRGSSLPTYKNTVNAIFTIGRMEMKLCSNMARNSHFQDEFFLA
ncbi:Folate transporter 1, chloroplastic, partial [Cucurbita argyrosperma subsp. argyrosperma]